MHLTWLPLPSRVFQALSIWRSPDSSFNVIELNAASPIRAAIICFGHSGSSHIALSHSISIHLYEFFFFVFLYSSRRSALGASHNALFIIHLANTISSRTHYKSHNKKIQELKTRGKLQGIAVPEHHNSGPGLKCDSHAAYFVIASIERQTCKQKGSYLPFPSIAGWWEVCRIYDQCLSWRECSNHIGLRAHRKQHILTGRQTWFRWA